MYAIVYFVWLNVMVLRQWLVKLGAAMAFTGLSHYMAPVVLLRLH
jgi:hypothetical protein